MAAEGQQHPLKHLLLDLGAAVLVQRGLVRHGLPAARLRSGWGLILLFMFLKAGFIVAIFMHMAWERLALIYAILGPPVVLLVLIGLMAVEGDYTELTRLDFFSRADSRPLGTKPATRSRGGTLTSRTSPANGRTLC